MVGWVMVDTLRDRKTRRIADGFETELSRVANRALQRYLHPGGIPADTEIEMTFTFGIQYQMR